MIIDPRHLEQLSVIVEEGSLQLAATRMGKSQPALSRMISLLEARVGALLFDRSKRPIAPTAIGLELSHQGRAIRNARIRATEAVDLGQQGFFGVLKVGAPPFLCKNLMSQAVTSFLELRPNIRVDLTPDYHTGLMERIYLNQLDLVVGPSKFVEKGNTDLIQEVLFLDKIGIVGRAQHPLIVSDAPTPDELSEVTWVGHSEKSMLILDMEAALNALGVRRPRVAFQSESAGAVLEILKETDFLTVLPSYAIQPDGSDGLAMARVAIPGDRDEICAITLRDKTQSKLTLDFKAHLHERMG